MPPLWKSAGQDRPVFSPARLARVVTDVIYPRQCCVCGLFFHFHETGPGTDIADPDQTGLTGLSFYNGPVTSVVCPDCAPDFKPVTSPLCSRCGLMFADRWGLSHTCGQCNSQPPFFTSARAAAIYDDPLKAVIHKFKYQKQMNLAEPLGRLLWQAFGQWFDPGAIDIVLPVPLHRKKFKQRGFNQSHRLLCHWLKYKGSREGLGKKINIQKNLLLRHRPTCSQTRLTPAQRLENVKGAFGVNPVTTVKEKRLLLVDDVLTTGATVNECARVLKNQGAARIDVLTLARV